MSIGTWIQQSLPTLTFIVCASLILFLRSMPCNWRLPSPAKMSTGKLLLWLPYRTLITYTAFLGGDQLIQDAKIFFQQVISWIQQGRSFDDGTNHTVLILPPQFRMQPHWYRQYYTCVLAVFEEVF